MCNKKIYSKTAECDVDFNLSTTEIAYHKETNTMHDVYESVKCYVYGNCLGNIKIVLDKDKNVIAEITPRFLSTENNGYQIIRFKQIDECQKICAAYSIYVKEYALNQMLEGITIPQELL